MISKATLEDVSALNELVNSAYRGDSSKQGWTTEADLIDGTRTDEDGIIELLKTPNLELLKYVENGEILGCVELRIEAKKLYLGMLTVSPKLQGKGLGKILLEAAETTAQAKGCLSVYMTVLSVREELIAWYERKGYRQTGERKPFGFNHPRFGKPKRQLEFVVLEKELI